MPKVNTSLQNLGATLKKASEQKKEIPNVQPSAPQMTQLGRKKHLLTSRKNSITIYCTDETMDELNEIKYNNRVERQRVLQTAIYEFLKAHYSENIKALDQEGMNKVIEFQNSIYVD